MFLDIRFIKSDVEGIINQHKSTCTWISGALYEQKKIRCRFTYFSMCMQTIITFWSIKMET